jgi:DNA-binding IclR family transcriptional regulator
MTSKTGDGRQIQSVGRACEIIKHLYRNGDSTVAELATGIDLTPGTIHTHLTTLCHQGIVDKDGKHYRLGLSIVTFGDRVRNRIPLYQAGRSETEALAEKTGEVTHLIIENDGLEVILHEAFGEQAAGRELYVKNRGRIDRHLHYSAAGKAILAFLPDERVEAILDEHGLVERTTNTVTDREELYEEMAEIRDRGFAINDEEGVRGIRAVGVPIHDTRDRVIGSISLSAPASRLREDRFTKEVPEIVEQSANVIEVGIQADQFDVPEREVI